MKVQHRRPSASQLALRLFQRTLHPELFTRVAEAELRLGDFVAIFRICEAGHTVEIRKGNVTLMEVMGPYDQDLPERGRCFGYHLRGSRDASHALECGIQYCCSAQLEQLEPELFWDAQQELSRDAQRAFLTYEFPTEGHRLAPAPLSTIEAELTRDSLVVHAFHTFPESLTILRTQSLLQF
ncbi:MAG: DUF2617 family protein [Planctomycetaceae bacterium]